MKAKHKQNNIIYHERYNRKRVSIKNNIVNELDNAKYNTLRGSKKKPFKESNFQMFCMWDYVVFGGTVALLQCCSSVT